MSGPIRPLTDIFELCGSLLSRTYRGLSKRQTDRQAETICRGKVALHDNLLLLYDNNIGRLGRLVSGSDKDVLFETLSIIISWRPNSAHSESKKHQSTEKTRCSVAPT